MLAGCRKDDLVLVLVSGGGSSLLELPLPGLTLTDLQVINQLLLSSGLPIQNVNTIRSALSRVKAGGLARRASPARVVSLILSDVIGDALGSVASGPTILQPDLRRKGQQILAASGLWSELRAPIRAVLTQDFPPRQRTPRPKNILLAGNRQLVEGAVTACERRGYQSMVLSRQMHGEASAAGRRFAMKMVRLAENVDRPTCCIMGGETTVRVTGMGVGGRNQEFALAAAGLLAGHDRITIASLASDGQDGPTDAAGAIVDGRNDRPNSSARPGSLASPETK